MPGGLHVCSAYFAGKIDAPVSDLKTKQLDDKTIVLVMSGKTTSEGTLYNPEHAPKPRSTAREYTSNNVRRWDKYVTPERNAIWYTTLQKDSTTSRYKLSENGLFNALKDTGLESPIPGDLGAASGGDFDISAGGVTFLAKDPTRALTKHLKSNLYFIPLNFTEDAIDPIVIDVPGFEGASSSPVFSPDGRSIAFLKSKDERKWYDRNRIFVSRDLSNKLTLESFAHEWSLSPAVVSWDNNGRELYVIAEEEARDKLFKLAFNVPTIKSSPTAIVIDGSVSEAHRCGPDDCLLITQSNLIDSSFYSILNTSTGKSRLISSISKNGSAFGLSSSQISDTWFKGHGDYIVHALIIKPSSFDEGKRYPLALLIHGGPQSSWKEAWSTRWNPAVFAEQGYVVVLPNFTGSLGYGQDFTEGIVGEWGGRAYQDIVCCFDHIEENMKFVDTNRAVAGGGSFGGYMTNWIAGQPLAKRLKALVCHDGLFSLYNMYSSDVAVDVEIDFGGDLWDRKSAYDQWDPAQHTQDWSTPMLIIHSDLDYRCPISEGWAPYAVCQIRGIESRFLNFPDENHFVLKPENSLHWHQTVLGWINKHAGVKGGVVLKPPASELIAASTNTKVGE